MRANQRRIEVLARYVDPHGRSHRVVFRGHLVLDLCRDDRPRVVDILAEGEGESQARALLDGSAIDEGYLARARREHRPFIRVVTAEDLRPPEADAAEADSALADAAERPLAA